jgi:hypothetical protein
MGRPSRWNRPDPNLAKNKGRERFSPRPSATLTYVFSDRLRSTEVERTERAISALSELAWAKPLLSRLKRAGGIQPENMPLMFEVRFADELRRAGVTARYEYAAGVGNSTVEFRLDTEPVWLIELVSVRISDAARRATRQIGPLYFEQLFHATPGDPGRSEEGEMILAEQKIGEKVFSRGRPTKFPPPDGSLRLILTDMRGYLDRGGDLADYNEIAYGWRALAHLEHGDMMVHHWKNADGKFEPIKGLFEHGNPLAAAKSVRERIHFLGFVREERFYDEEIQQTSLLLANPGFFASQDDVMRAYATFPLARFGPLADDG